MEHRSRRGWPRSHVAWGLALSALVTAAAPLSTSAQESSFVPQRTPWGDPDLRGHWLPGTMAPMENPIGDAWRLTEEELARYPIAQFFPGHQDAPGMKSADRPMVIDPPNGQIPLQEWAIEKRTEVMENQDQLEFLDPRVKCLPAAVPRGNLPVPYNSYQFLQVPGAVIILYEWNHHSRYIPLDGSPHVASDIRLGMGDSRGHWEGDTLVVDVTNFTDNTWAVGHGAPPEGAPATSITTGHGVFHSTDLHVVERYRLTDENTIHYEATITDPQVFTQPWTISYAAFNRATEDHILYEYACHEGNARNLKLMTGTDTDALVALEHVPR
jgi:hypothetical protein